MPILQTSSQKHLGITLDTQLNFDDHLKMVFGEISKTIGLPHKLQNLFAKASVIIMYKAFIRLHLDYGDVVYNQLYNMSFHQKLESIQYDACLAITGAMRSTSKEKLYQELGLESLQLWLWYRKLAMFYKIFKSKCPQYLLSKYLKKVFACYKKHWQYPFFNIKHNFYKNFFSCRRSLSGTT